MPEHRRKFSPQFKAEAVQMVIETGKPIAEVARDLWYPRRDLGQLSERVAATADTPTAVRRRQLAVHARPVFSAAAGPMGAGGSPPS
jgi:hypothetical protein